jgi:putative FmdB family regulatory protein
MPLWEFKCEQCEVKAEYLHFVGEIPTPPCPLCNAPMSKIISPGAIVFKGYGWTGKAEKRPEKDYSVKTEVVDDEEM